MRINKYISNCGICSRRKADQLIKSGKIQVNDEIIRNPGTQIEKKDIVKYNNRILKLENNLKYYIINKPINVITTCKDTNNRKTILDIIKIPTKIRIFPVGRLDRNTTGIIILTNDGNLTNKLTHPSFKITKKYKVTLDKELTHEDEKKLKIGVHLTDGFFKFDKIDILDRKNINVTMHSGKNRIIRRTFDSLNYKVKALDRYYYGGIEKKTLRIGEYRELTNEEIKMLKKL